MRSDPEKVQRDHIVPAEIPGIEIENNYEAVPGPAVKLEAEKEPMDVRKLALAARANACLSVVDTSLDKTRGVDDHGAHDDAPMVHLTGNDPFLSEKIQNRAKQKMVNNGESGSNDDNNTISPLQHQSVGDNSSDEEDDDMNEEYSGPVVEPQQMCQGKRVRRQVKYLVSTHKGQSYDQGVAFHHVSHLKVSKGDKVKGQIAGAGYSTKKGVLHFNFNYDTLCPTAMTEG